jgi:uncharacterized protein (DUF433 family)
MIRRQQPILMQLETNVQAITHTGCSPGSCAYPGHESISRCASGGGPVVPCLTLGCRTADDAYIDLGRISVDHRIMGGIPCVAGTRIPVATVMGLVADGLTTDEILAEYPQLIREDIQGCLGYAARAVDERELPVRLSA